MGSGALLAILVALWFVVLVPMVVTRGDLATAPAEPMRVLRRRSQRSATTESSGVPEMSSAGTHGHQVENMRTEPVPALPRRVPGQALRQEMASAPDPHGRTSHEPKPRKKGEELASGRSRTGSPVGKKPARAEVDLRARRRRMLVGMLAAAGVFALFAAFWEPVFWWVQVVLDLAAFSYLVFLRLEAQREQDRLERRLARACARTRMPEDRNQRLVRKQTEYRDHVTAVTGNQAIALDDDDPDFTEMPSWTPQVAMAAEAPAWHERKAV